MMCSRLLWVAILAVSGNVLSEARRVSTKDLLSHNTESKFSIGRVDEICTDDHFELNTSSFNKEQVAWWGASGAEVLGEICGFYSSCTELATTGQHRAKFPLFSVDWCDDTMQLMSRYLTDGEEDLLQLELNKDSKVLKIITDGEEKQFAAVTKHGRWASCAKESPEVEQGDKVAACQACTRETHRGGAPRFQITSFGCGWDPAEQACMAYGDLQPGGIKNFLDCAESADKAIVAGDSLLEESSSKRKAGGKKAFLVAYAYYDTKNYLGGTIPDIIRVFQHLTQKRGFDARDIIIVTDASIDDLNKYFYDVPASNVYQSDKVSGSIAQFIEALQRTIGTLEAGDYFYMHYSGHGSFTQDRDGDELDGLDETVVTANGEHVVDDMFYEQLVRVPAGVSTMIMVDACHSEGFSDLPFNYLSSHRIWCTDWAKPKRLPVSRITYISGSQNDETSADHGNGGALSLHAINLWTTPGQVYAMMDAVCSALATQDPSLSAFPSFRDTSMWSPYDHSVVLRRDAHNADATIFQKPPSQLEMVVPSICRHGDVDKRHKSHVRTKYREARKVFTVDTRLDSASRTLAAEVVEGYTDPVAIHEESTPWKKYIDQSTGRPFWNNYKTGKSTWNDPSVASPQPKAKCQCAHKRPSGEVYGDRCGKMMRNGREAATEWCYVDLDSTCRDVFASGLTTILKISELACGTGGVTGKPSLSATVHVVKKVVKLNSANGKCECAGKRPSESPYGSKCGKLVAGGEVAREWCYVWPDSTCSDAERSHLSNALLFSEKACESGVKILGPKIQQPKIQNQASRCQCWSDPLGPRRLKQFSSCTHAIPMSSAYAKDAWCRVKTPALCDDTFIESTLTKQVGHNVYWSRSPCV